MQQDVPAETIISIERVIEPEKDYNHVRMNVQDRLNELFPDGTLLHGKRTHFSYGPKESSLERIQEVQSQLEEQRASLQTAVDLLCETLTKEQDPERMQRIQELIAVCSIIRFPNATDVCRAY